MEAILLGLLVTQALPPACEMVWLYLRRTSFGNSIINAQGLEDFKCTSNAL